MSWHYLQGQEVASWEGTSLDGAPSALLSLMPTPEACCLPASATACCHGSRFGTTCEPSTASPGQEPCMLCRGASHAKTLAQPANEQEFQEVDLGFGERWRELSVRFDRDLCSWRTHHSLWDEDLTGFFPTLPAWGLMRDGVLLEQVTLARFTNVRGSGLWRTPDAGSNRNNATPSRCVIEGRARKDQQIRLADQVCLIHGINGRLNPEWVEWLMGWPIGWTDCNALETAKFHEWQQQHGACSLVA